MAFEEIAKLCHALCKRSPLSVKTVSAHFMESPYFGEEERINHSQSGGL